VQAVKLNCIKAKIAGSATGASQNEVESSSILYTLIAMAGSDKF